MLEVAILTALYLATGSYIARAVYHKMTEPEYANFKARYAAIVVVAWLPLVVLGSVVFGVRWLATGEW